MHIIYINIHINILSFADKVSETSKTNCLREVIVFGQAKLKAQKYLAAVSGV